MRIRCFEALPIAVALLLAAQPSLAHQAGRFVEVVSAATAQVVFTEVGQRGIFLDAELAYGGMRLLASQVEFDSLTQKVTLSGQVRLAGPEYEMTTARCEADLSTGVLRAAGGLSLSYKAQGVSAASDTGALLLDINTLQPRSAELLGNVSAAWEEGLELSGKQLHYDFDGQLCTLDDGFTAVIAGPLFSEQTQRLTGGGMTIRGNKAFLKTEGVHQRRLLFTASEITVKAERLGVAGNSLAANLAAEKGAGSGVEQTLFVISGSESAPVKGWLLDNEGNVINFSAQSVEKKMGSTELVLSGSVSVAGKEFSLSANVVVAVPEGSGVRMTIPDRFRVELAPGLFQGEERSAGAKPTG